MCDKIQNGQVHGWLIKAFAIGISLYHVLYISGVLRIFGIYLVTAQHRAISIGTITALTLLVYPMKGKGGRVLWYDYILAFAALIPSFYIAIFYNSYVSRALAVGAVNSLEMVLGIALLIVLFEATRRALGIAMPLIAFIFALHMILGQYLTGVFATRGYSLSRIIFHLYLSEQGIFGIAAGVAARIVVLFIIFGVFLNAAGAGRFFTDIALSLVGHLTGGIAKVSVIASAIMGTISGSTSANIATTGSITIPMMKESGYKPHFAAAVEAVASNGGQIMPPVMGAVAFLIAEWLVVPYYEVMRAAIIPAILYFVVVFIQVDLEARKGGIKPFRREELPKFSKVLKEGWFHVIPILVLLFFLIILGYTPEKAVFYALLSLLVVSMFYKDTRMGPKKIFEALYDGAMGTLVSVTACATAGVIIGSVLLTGLGFKLSGLLVAFSGGNLILLLIIAAAACFILGMGLGSTAAYLIVVLLVAPALINLGIYDMAAHLFVFYFALTSFITPPVAIGAYVAAAIAETSPWKTSFTCIRLGITSYLLPFIFVLNNALLLKGSISEILFTITITVLVSFNIAIGCTGFLFKPIQWSHRCLLFVSTLLILLNLIGNLSWFFSAAGVLISIGEILWQLKVSSAGAVSDGLTS